jgi:hypothetical protein
LEGSELVEAKLLAQIAEALKVPVEAIENFTEEGASTYFNSFYDSSATSAHFNYQCAINPLDKYFEMVEKNERLYEALLKAEREKIVLLERLVENGN